MNGTTFLELLLEKPNQLCMTTTHSYSIFHAWWQLALYILRDLGFLELFIFVQGLFCSHGNTSGTTVHVWPSSLVMIGLVLTDIYNFRTFFGVGIQVGLLLEKQNPLCTSKAHRQSDYQVWWWSALYFLYLEFWELFFWHRNMKGTTFGKTKPTVCNYSQ